MIGEKQGKRLLEQRTRRNRLVGAAAVFVGGAIAAVSGFLIADGRSGHATTAAGVLSGLGAGLCLAALILGWKTQVWDARWRSEPPHSRRERLLAQRARQLWLLPAVTLVLLTQAARTMYGLHDGQFRYIDYFWILLPVLYAWVIALTTMGRDYHSLRNRRFLEDELTQAFRARALGTAFLVLMVGSTIALCLGLWRQELGVLALPFALSAAGVAAGFRFVWLDREAGRDG